MLVERVYDPWHYLMLGAVHSDHGSLARDAVTRLEVVLVLEPGLCAGANDRVRNGVAHAIGLQQESAAQAVAPFDGLHVVQLTNDHRHSLLKVIWFAVL